MSESKKERASRILAQLSLEFPNSSCWDVDGSGNHFVSEVEPSKDHPDYDRAVEVIIRTIPHKHLKMTQYYTVLSGSIKLHIEGDVFIMASGDKHTVQPHETHWAESDDEAWVEIYSRPGWTREDHIEVKEQP